MSKKKCDNKELKKQVEQLENMVQTMKSQMKSTETSKEYKFNEEQMVEFTSLLCARFNELMLNSIQELEFSNDVVDIEVDSCYLIQAKIRVNFSRTKIKKSDERMNNEGTNEGTNQRTNQRTHD